MENQDTEITWIRYTGGMDIGSYFEPIFSVNTDLELIKERLENWDDSSLAFQVTMIQDTENLLLKRNVFMSQLSGQDINKFFNPEKSERV